MLILLLLLFFDAVDVCVFSVCLEVGHTTTHGSSKSGLYNKDISNSNICNSRVN